MVHELALFFVAKMFLSLKRCENFLVRWCQNHCSLSLWLLQTA